jgi:hypothetical protein
MQPVVVFLGPTLPHHEAREVLDAEYRPPAAQGDVLRAALRRPRVIALVDGVFERTPSVWHKEILFALSEGIHVYGAASMGALRAAELAAFGMRGVGEVYRAYAQRELEDDDEVAVAHADAGQGFRPLSEAMVDVRATLAAAVAAGVVGEVSANRLLARVKETHYAGRVLLAALDRSDAEHELLRRWLPDGRVERKRRDALDLLAAIAGDLGDGLEPFRPRWTLQRTRYWEDALRRAGTEPGTPATTAPTSDEELEAVLDEVRLDPAAYRLLAERSLLTALARNAAAATGVDVAPWAQQVALDDERLHRGLLEPADVDAWLDEHGLARTDLPDLARRLAALRWAREAHADAVTGEIALTLRSDAAYGELAARALRKREVIASLPSGRAGAIDDVELVGWYFRELLGREVPFALDAWAAAQGWPGTRELVRAVRGEWAFRQVEGGATSVSSSWRNDRPTPATG